MHKDFKQKVSCSESTHRACFFFARCIFTGAALTPQLREDERPGREAPGQVTRREGGTPGQHTWRAGREGTMPKATQLLEQIIHFFNSLPVSVVKGTCEWVLDPSW